MMQVIFEGSQVCFETIFNYICGTNTIMYYIET